MTKRLTRRAALARLFLLAMAVTLGLLLAALTAKPAHAYGPYCVNTIVRTGDFRVGPVHFYPSDKECVEVNP